MIGKHQKLQDLGWPNPVRKALLCGILPTLIHATLVSTLFSPAQAAMVTTMQFPYATLPSFRWSESMQLKLSGTPVMVRKFVASQSLDQAAQTMAKHRDKFQRVTTLPGTILLSGTYNDHHWVAQLEAYGDQVQGMVSTLPIQLTVGSNQNSSGSLVPWLTHDASHVFEHSPNHTNRRATHSVHLTPNSTAFINDLGRRLSRQGWQRRSESSWEQLKSGKKHPSRIKAYRVDMPTSGGAVLVHQSH